MKLPLFRSLSVEGFPGQQRWIGKLVEPFNVLAGNVAIALSNGLTFGDNIDCQLKTFNFSPSSKFPYEFATTTRNKPEGVWIIGVRNTNDTTVALTTPVQFDWEYIGESRIKITKVLGLNYTGSGTTSDPWKLVNKYQLKAIVIGG
jgi:hypothetical protein